MIYAVIPNVRTPIIRTRITIIYALIPIIRTLIASRFRRSPIAAQVRARACAAASEAFIAAGTRPVRPPRCGGRAACLSAPTSFVPSPHIIVVTPADLNVVITSSFCSGDCASVGAGRVSDYSYPYPDYPYR